KCRRTNLAVFPGTKNSLEPSEPPLPSSGSLAPNVLAVCRTPGVTSTDADEVCAFGPLPEQNHGPLDRLSARNPQLRIRHALVVDVHAAREHQPPRFGL